MSNSRFSSRSPLQEHILPLHCSNKEMLQSSLTILPLATTIHPRKYQHPTTLFALVSLIFLSAYVFLIHHPDINTSFTLRRPDPKPAPSQLSLALELMYNSRLPAAHQESGAMGGKIQLNSSQELAAISSFLASLPQNQIPSSVDPLKPLDPQLILDFDTRGSRASEEVRAMVEEVWSRNPVFLYSKLYSSPSREVKAILDDMNLRPSPTIIDVDVRDDAEVLIPVLTRLTSSTELPILIIGGKPVGSIQDIKDLSSNGILRQMITHSGAVIDGSKRKKKH